MATTSAVASSHDVARKGSFDRAQMGRVSDTYEAVAEGEDFADEETDLVAVVQHEGLDTRVHTDQCELQVGIAIKGTPPIVAERGLPPDHATTLRNHTRCSWR